MIKRRLWPIVIFLFLIATWVHAGNITVSSLEDTNTRDDVITLREAILISEGRLAPDIFDVLTDAEAVHISLPVGRGIADTINFSVSGIITPTSSLPNVADDGTVIDASSQWIGVWPNGETGVILNGKDAGNVPGLVITGAANCHIRGLFITGFGEHGAITISSKIINYIGGTQNER